eukprot:COSAG01_NODE_45496_length_409_cov_0.509677_2_plen_34_part_01
MFVPEADTAIELAPVKTTAVEEADRTVYVPAGTA